MVKTISSRHHAHTHGACSFKGDIVWYVKLEVTLNGDVPGKRAVFVIGIISWELLSTRTQTRKLSLRLAS